ncbi:prolyl oligopeptidase family serine peptidase [Sphingomonas nostoxanthinifaciens]|uniref:prolyl oligopeptidase family serine peptidase n=1 Tax=Sphingomonas nostoxanthinifaciens TaxID=2872652 RepID=UPI001CC1E046|nr:prolyl oligopeptidase family serine peptidase [Sphingomonas nostoxanthinifaciens]UAK23571.1 prolyl oligopeptidase family serine peptidase [Sphingomonas nostoxanthinifaciens]
MWSDDDIGGMFMIDRRQLLAGSAASLVGAAVAARGRAASPAIVVPPAPVAKLTPTRDTYFGETLVDRYRWMENDKDPDWLPYLKAQNDRTRAVLDRLPGRDALLARIQQLSGDIVLTSKVQRAGGRIFFQQRPLGADNFKLFVRENGADRVLVDPTAMSAAGVGHYSLDWWHASPAGDKVVYGVSKDGSEDSVLHILTVADGHDLPERIANTQMADPRWLDDGTGFFYNQLTGAVDTPERFLDSQARFHRIGTDPSTDPIVMKRGLDPAIVFEKIQAPYVLTFPGSRYAILGLGDVRPEARMFVAPVADALAGKARWVPVTDFPDEVTSAEIDGDDLYLLVNKGSPRGRIVRMHASAPSLATATVVVPQGAQVIEDIARAKDGLYLKIMDGGISRLRRLGRDGRVAEVALPFDGTIGAVFAEPDLPGVLMPLSGWLTPTGIWSVDAAGRVADTGITPRPAIDTSPYEAKRFFATVRDGTKVPYTLIYRKGMKLDGSAPCWISAYGSYGAAAYTPSFQQRQLALIDQGAVVGYANVRGGGEYGREWHKAGQLANKPNTWRDLIDVCQDICVKRYTSPAHLAIGGRSAGGITVGRALTERPDLFAAVIDGVGWSNPLRYVVEQNGYGEEPEWGAIADPDGYRYLKAIDSYHAVKDGTAYPAVLLTTGVTDPRVAPFHVAKMTARLQAASTSGKPILLRVDYDAGHGIGSTRAQQDREAADTYAFLLWQTKPGGSPHA